MNYYAAAIALKLASLNGPTRSVYSALTSLRSGPRIARLDRARWLMSGLPQSRQTLLDLGTGWAHVYSLYPAFLRDDELHTFDAHDLRNWKSFRATLPLVYEQIMKSDYPKEVLARVKERFSRFMKCTSWDEFYSIANISMRVDPTGRIAYPDNFFDQIGSIDVLEHVDRDSFASLCRDWYRVIKPGGRFLAQVGLDDHTMFYTGRFFSKRYLRYSDLSYQMWLGNSVQYINRLPASSIINMLGDAGFVIDEAEINQSGDVEPKDVHPDYRSQSDEDIRAVRLTLRARKI